MTAQRRTSAIAALAPGSVDLPDAFVEIEVDLPALGDHDLLVDVRAVSVNPVDTKVRKGFDASEAPKVLGYDAAGVVTEIGSGVTEFAVGDEVFYAGSIGRPGTNSLLHVVDERVVGHKPTSLDFAEAAALPLTSITAWETLFDRLRLDRSSTGTLLVMSGAGGVGSMIIQLARALTRVTVIATAGRPESRQWATELGAHHVVDRHALLDEVLQVAPDGVEYLFTPFSEGNVETFAELLTVRGEIVAIDDPVGLDLLPLKTKSLTWHWELMFTRPLFAPDDPYQHELLDAVARMVDAGTLRTTMTTRLSPITPENLREAHRQVETSGVVGKVVVSRD